MVARFRRITPDRRTRRIARSTSFVCCRRRRRSPRSRTRIDRAAVSLSAERAELHTEHPADDVRRTGGEICGLAVVDRALNLLLIPARGPRSELQHLHVRMVGAAAPILRVRSAGICALWGPLHGGANQQVIEMLRRSGESVTARRSSSPRQGEKLGIQTDGIRTTACIITSTRAPRSSRSRRTTSSAPWACATALETAKELEQIALSDPYFIERKLYPNVDFYSGIIYRAMGHPHPTCSPSCSPSASAGLDRAVEGNGGILETRINRPLQLYVRKHQRSLVPIEDGDLVATAVI